MGRMIEDTIKSLYAYGKKVYENKLSLVEAAQEVNRIHPEVAVSSAKHYINWYSEMRAGRWLSWNSNSNLLLYYVEHIKEDDGIEAGKLALQGAEKFAEHAKRKELMEDLNKLALRLSLVGQKKDNDNISSERSDDEMDNKAIVEQIKHFISQKGFSYPDNIIESFFLSLKTKPFVILAGTSGTGKTRLVRLFAEAVGAFSAGEKRYLQVPVRPDWSDSSDLFGHLNLNGDFVKGPFTDFLKSAEENPEYPYFLCLDEMNLARVEYYMSDLLSIMETRDVVDGRIVTDKIYLNGYGDFGLPENLYIVGTVNMDETTFPFSKKVLDRANTIEFSYVNLVPDFEEVRDSSPVRSFTLSNDFFRAEYLYLAQCGEDDRDYVLSCSVELEKINAILREANAHVGYRVRDEIAFYRLYNHKMHLMNEMAAMDYEILQKILPRIQGSSGAVRDMLVHLFQYCAGEYEGFRTDTVEVFRKMEAALADKAVHPKYPKSAEKIAFMMRRLEEDGFTSYWF